MKDQKKQKVDFNMKFILKYLLQHCRKSWRSHLKKFQARNKLWTQENLLCYATKKAFKANFSLSAGKLKTKTKNPKSFFNVSVFLHTTTHTHTHVFTCLNFVVLLLLNCCGLHQHETIFVWYKEVLERKLT